MQMWSMTRKDRQWKCRHQKIIPETQDGLARTILASASMVGWQNLIDAHFGKPGLLEAGEYEMEISGEDADTDNG